MLVVFTDLDGTLLDRDTYSFEAAVPALKNLEEAGVPVVLVSSKTRKEIEFWRQKLKNRYPFCVENGAAVVIPAGTLEVPGQVVHEGEYDVVEFGVPYRQLTIALKGAARESGCRVRGFSDMAVHEISRHCDLPMEQAILAQARQYDEPFVILKGDPDLLRLSIEKRHLRLTSGGRFFHITGSNDKSDAVMLLIEAYRRQGQIRTIGVGDGPNDAGFLNLVDYPVLLDSPHAEEVRKQAPRARMACAGPPGWNQALLEILSELRATADC